MATSKLADRVWLVLLVAFLASATAFLITGWTWMVGVCGAFAFATVCSSAVAMIRRDNVGPVD